MRNVIVVGATGTIGSEICRALHDDCNLVTISHKSKPLFASEHHHIDLTQSLTEDILEKVFGNMNHVDALIWSPGIQHFNMLEDTPITVMDIQYQLNLGNLFVVVKALLPKLKKSSNGRIIVISSIWGETGASFETIYSAMKGGQIAFVKALAKEMARTSVTVNAIAPGVVESHMLQALSDEDKIQLLNELPQGKMVQAEEVVHAVKYLLDEKSGSVTGEVMRINGGWYT